MTDHATRADVDWKPLAQQLADNLAQRLNLRDPAWREAVAAVPRHLLVPTVYQQDTTGTWHPLDASSPEGLALVYSPQTLITAFEDRGSARIPVSSSTKPDLMLRMLDHLDIRDGQRVLEIGTGTGYNAALLSHRLGERNVFSVDIDPDLITTARERLASIGCRPTLAAVDGEQGLPDHAPYDRIIATCSVPAVPQAWLAQLADGGRALVDIKLAVGAGNLADLHRDGDRLEGRFTDWWGGFMAIRHEHDQPQPAAPPAANSQKRTTTAPAEPWFDEPVVWFLAQFQLPRGATHGMRFDGEGRPTASTLTLPDGAWAAVSLDGDSSARPVEWAGTIDPWKAIEDAHLLWERLGRPSWERFGLTVTPDRQWVWLDAPDGEHRWQLGSSRRPAVAP